MAEVSYLPLIEDMVWSYSRIKSFEGCPYRFFLKYLSAYPKALHEKDQFYSSYGTFMHKIIERYYRGELSKNEMLTEYLTGFSSNVKGVRPAESTVQKYIKCGADYLRNFQPFPYNMVAVEKKVNFTLGGMPFVGFIDYLGERDGKLYVIDNKSRDLKPRSKRKNPTVKDKELDSMLRQLYLYSTAVKDEYGQFPEALCFNCFKAGVFIEEPFSGEAYNQAVLWAMKTIDDIKHTEDFYPCQDYFSCRFICGVGDDCIYDQMAYAARKRGE